MIFPLGPLIDLFQIKCIFTSPAFIDRKEHNPFIFHMNEWNNLHALLQPVTQNAIQNCNYRLTTRNAAENDKEKDKTYVKTQRETIKLNTWEWISDNDSQCQWDKNTQQHIMLKIRKCLDGAAGLTMRVKECLVKLFQRQSKLMENLRYKHSKEMLCFIVRTEWCYWTPDFHIHISLLLKSRGHYNKYKGHKCL